MFLLRLCRFAVCLFVGFVTTFGKLSAKHSTHHQPVMCQTATVSFTVSSATSASLSNQGGTGNGAVLIRAGGLIQVSPLSSNVPTSSLRFLDKLTSNGNVRFAGGTVPLIRTQLDYPSSYFGQSYGTYTLIDPTLTGTLSETYTPYIDLNSNQQYDSNTECLGTPVVLSYTIYPACDIRFIMTGSSSVSVSNQNGPMTAAISLCSGGWMNVSSLTSPVTSTKLRFIEATTSNGNVVFTGYTVPTTRTSQILSRSYFNQTYGRYTLNNPAITGTLSETFTPFIDQNNNGLYDSATEFLDTPLVVNYEVKTNNTQASIQSAGWSAQTTWSYGRIPLTTDTPTIRHMVWLPAGYVAVSKEIRYEPGGLLQYAPTSQLYLYRQP
jgi:hypothetical protein